MSVVSELTVADFKELFPRNFPYLPYYNEEKTYFCGDIVYLEPNFYQSLVDNNNSDVEDGGYWQVVNVDKNDYVSDEDITRAWGEALLSYNESLFEEDDFVKESFLYLVAFFLAYDLSLAQTGAYGAIGFPATEVKVGSVSEGYYIPKVYLENPVLGFYARNGFGLKYLNMVYPKLVGNVGVVAGWSLP